VRIIFSYLEEELVCRQGVLVDVLFLVEVHGFYEEKGVMDGPLQHYLKLRKRINESKNVNKGERKWTSCYFSF